MNVCWPKNQRRFISTWFKSRHSAECRHAPIIVWDQLIQYSKFDVKLAVREREKRVRLCFVGALHGRAPAAKDGWQLHVCYCGWQLQQSYMPRRAAGVELRKTFLATSISTHTYLVSRCRCRTHHGSSCGCSLSTLSDPVSPSCPATIATAVYICPSVKLVWEGCSEFSCCSIRHSSSSRKLKLRFWARILERIF